MFSQRPDPREGNFWVHRFMIDRRHQGKGYGSAAMQELLNMFRARYYDLPHALDRVRLQEHRRARFYSKLGFVEQGEAPWGRGELMAKIDLPE